MQDRIDAYVEQWPMLGAVCGASYMRCTRVYTRVKFRVVAA
eukprot:SAG31_NODE_40013_length_283_cov_206.809783_1_plen_40_part_10